MTRYGYAAMNVTLREEDVRTNRGMQKTTFEERRLEYAGEIRFVSDSFRRIRTNG